MIEDCQQKGYINLKIITYWRCKKLGSLLTEDGKYNTEIGRSIAIAKYALKRIIKLLTNKNI